MGPHNYEEDLGYIKATLESLDVRINGSMNKIGDHIKQGNLWRISIVGIVCAGIIQVISFAYLFGGLSSIAQETKESLNRHILCYETRVHTLMKNAVTLKDGKG